MKVRSLAVLLLAFFLSPSTYAQSGKQYYVVIGVFKNLDNAQRLAQKAQTQNLAAKYEMNPALGLHYVYVLQSSARQDAFALAIKLRAETDYKETWVFGGALGESPAEQRVEVEREPVMPEIKPEPIVQQVEQKPEPVVAQEEPTVKEDTTQTVVEQPVVEKPKPAGKPFFFRMISEASGNAVVGEIQILESAKATQYESFRSNEVVYLPPPKNRNATYQVVTLSPGYQEMRRTLNYADPASSASEMGPDQEFIISLPLVRVKQGDYIEFSNVRFFANSAILQPESKNELDGLVQLMRENVKYKISIHGHVNSEGNRDIASKGGSADFFTTSTENLKENATAKKLSQLRADIVKEYLVSQGIDDGRIQTKAHGGKEMIYPKSSTLASRNDRIEVEIKKGK